MIDRIICAGFGGQGVMSMGRLIAYTGMQEGREVSWLPSYGPEMRGGTANCHVLVSDTPIGSPVISKDATAVIAMNLPSVTKFQGELAPGKLLIYNSDLIENVDFRTDIDVLPVPANAIAREVGNPKGANMVMLGAYIGSRGLFSLESVVEALKKVFGPGKAHFIGPNETALRRGIDLAQKVAAG
ncbi:MAG: 2-oxoacid:acceptor oxidoreductase family protein [Spirochaetaceae bacterium]